MSITKLFLLTAKIKKMDLIKTLYVFFCLITPGISAEVIVNLAPENTYFVGRNNELDSIRKKIAAQTIFTLYGSPGVGKTQIAKAYSWQQKSHYDFIWWINATQLLDTQVFNFVKHWNEVFKNESVPASSNIKKQWQDLKNHFSTTAKKGLIMRAFLT